MGLALGQPRLRHGRRGSKAGEPQRILHDPSGVPHGELARIGAEMLVEPRAPGKLHRVPHLKHRAAAAPLSAVHQARMPAMAAGQHVRHQRGLAVAPHRQHDAGLAPMHAPQLSKSRPIAS